VDLSGRLVDEADLLLSGMSEGGELHRLPIG
jgi:hypothetical protein